MKKIIAVAAAALVLMAGCGVEPDPGYEVPGKVTSKARRSVTVLQDNGATVTHRTTKAKSRSCSPGERWPAC